MPVLAVMVMLVLTHSMAPLTQLSQLKNNLFALVAAVCFKTLRRFIMKKTIFYTLCLSLFALIIYSTSFITNTYALPATYQQSDASKPGDDKTIEKINNCLAVQNTVLAYENSVGAGITDVEAGALCTEAPIPLCSTISFPNNTGTAPVLGKGMPYYAGDGTVIQEATGYTGNFATSPTLIPGQFVVTCICQCCRNVVLGP
jgi:hypothetical protein